MGNQLSLCGNGYFHDYQIKRTFSQGVMEVCTRCKDTQYFRQGIPNYLYLQYHLRSTLQKNHPAFIREYKSNK